MITNVSLVSVWVHDLDEALAFYTDVLGFQPGDDVSLGDDFRWLTVTHPSQPELHLHLTTPGRPLSDDLVDAIRRAQAAGGMPGVARFPGGAGEGVAIRRVGAGRGGVRGGGRGVAGLDEVDVPGAFDAKAGDQGLQAGLEPLPAERRKGGRALEDDHVR